MSIESLTEGLGDTRPAPPSHLPIRLAVGLAQGLALYALYLADGGKNPSTVPEAWRWLWGGLLLASLVKPLVFIGGLGALRRPVLFAWTGVAGLIAFAVAAFNVGGTAGAYNMPPIPQPQIFPMITALVFIAHHLIAAADADRRLLARYVTYFDLAWKHGVQLALAGAFVGVFWGVLGLGAVLFNVIGIKAVETLITEVWFALPATTVMFAAAIHLTDMRVGLIRGIRTVALTLLSWLLPLLAGLTGAFLVALLFTGLKPLWDTRAANGILLATAAAMIILVNAAYQDGRPERATPAVLRWAARVGAVLVGPLIGIAAYALMLRVGQYGLTPERVMAAACVLVGACYSLGYLVAAVRPGPWLKTLEATNVATAVVGVAVLLALLTPVADPQRLSVDDQLGRIIGGRIKADAVDYDFLRWSAGKRGVAALETLKTRGGEVGARAEAALKETERSYGGRLVPPLEATAEVRARQITLHDAKAKAMPAGFNEQAWQDAQVGPLCLTTAGERCDAFLADLNGDSRPDVLLLDGKDDLWLFSQEKDAPWRLVGTLDLCGSPREALLAGRVKAVEPEWKALDLGGRRTTLTPQWRCPAEPAPPPGSTGAPPQMKNAGKLGPVQR